MCCKHLPCLAGYELTDLQAILRFVFPCKIILLALFDGNPTWKRIGFDLTLQGAYVQVSAFFRHIRPRNIYL